MTMALSKGSSFWNETVKNVIVKKNPKKAKMPKKKFGPTADLSAQPS
jgi:hypothetical protein